MMTFSFSSKHSIISADFNPPIDLRQNKNDFVLGLLSLEVYNAIPNIAENNNKFYIDNEIIEIPTGTYDVDNINDYLNLKLKELLYTKTFKSNLYIKANLNTLKCVIKCDHDIDFTKDDSIGSLLGFDKEILTKNKQHESKNPVDIMKVNSIKILCNIVSGSYENGKPAHTLHEFFPTVPAGFKIVESPQNVIYLPINTNFITNITFKIVDQDGNLLNFREETITIRAHLKPLINNGF